MDSSSRELIKFLINGGKVNLNNGLKLWNACLGIEVKEEESEPEGFTNVIEITSRIKKAA